MLIRRATAREHASLLDRAYGRRPGCGFARRGGFRGIGGGVSPLFSVLNNGTFTRSTEGYEFTKQDIANQDDAGAYLSSNVRRPDVRGGGGLLIEASVANNLSAAKETLDTWTLVSATVDADVVLGPHGTTTADRVNFSAAATARVETNVATTPTDNANQAMTVYARMASGSGSFRIALINKAGASDISSDISVGTEWRRYTIIKSASVGASTAGMRIQNGSDGAARSVLFSLPQLEEQSFPSSPIRGSTGAQTRGADVLSMSSSGSAWVNKRHSIDVYPLGAPGEYGSNRYVYWLASGHILRWLTASSKFEVLAGGASKVLSNALTFSREQKLTLTIDATAGTIAVSGATTGDGEVSGTAWSWSPAATSYIGSSNGTSPFDAVYSNARAA